MWELWHYTILRYNLLILMFCWISSSFGFYMLAYILKYLNGNIFVNSYCSAAGEILGKLSLIPILRCTSLKRVFLICWSTAVIGTLFLIIFSDNETLIPIMLIIARFGYA